MKTRADRAERERKLKERSEAFKAGDWFRVAKLDSELGYAPSPFIHAFLTPEERKELDK